MRRECTIQCVFVIYRFSLCKHLTSFYILHLVTVLSFQLCYRENSIVYHISDTHKTLMNRLWYCSLQFKCFIKGKAKARQNFGSCCRCVCQPYNYDDECVAQCFSEMSKMCQISNLKQSLGIFRNIPLNRVEFNDFRVKIIRPIHCLKNLHRPFHLSINRLGQGAWILKSSILDLKCVNFRPNNLQNNWSMILYIQNCLGLTTGVKLEATF